MAQVESRHLIFKEDIFFPEITCNPSLSGKILVLKPEPEKHLIKEIEVSQCQQILLKELIDNFSFTFCPNLSKLLEMILHYRKSFTLVKVDLNVRLNLF